MTLPKTVTKRIVELWGIGASAEETQKALADEDIKLCTNTIYAKRKSITAQEMIEELIRKQLRDIAQCGDDYRTRLEYRDRMLDKYMPKKTENKNEQIGEIKLKWIDNAKSNIGDTI